MRDWKNYDHATTIGSIEFEGCGKILEEDVDTIGFRVHCATRYDDGETRDDVVVEVLGGIPGIEFTMNHVEAAILGHLLLAASRKALDWERVSRSVQAKWNEQ